MAFRIGSRRICCGESICVLYASASASFLLVLPARAQDNDPPTVANLSYDALSWRGIGPAFTSGRIADIAIHPDDPQTWYVAVGSGGVWMTSNSGST